MSEVKLRRAALADADAVAGCVRRAYARYAGRLPRPPKPTLADYASVVQDEQAWMLESADGACLGVLVLVPCAELGRRLLAFAEAEAARQGFGEIRLYTHALMTENRALYARGGFVEYERRVVDGRDAVYMRKTLT
jgi:hypothetical protein